MGSRRGAVGLTEAAQDPSAGPRIITVGGGRGGIGKSTVAAQLAWASAQMGRRVVLVDADLAAPSQHLLLGAGGAPAGLSGLMGREDRSAIAASGTGHPNLQLIAGGGRNQLRPGAVNPAARLRLIERLRAMQIDLAIVDVGAGLGYDAADLFELGDQRVIVATGQAASLHEAFALLKTVVGRTVRRHLVRSRQIGLLEPAVRTPEGERISDVLRRVHAVDPELAAQVTASLDRFGVFLFGNQLPDGSQMAVLESAVTRALDYLSVPLTMLGWLRAGAGLPPLSASDDPPPAESDEAHLFRQAATELAAATPADTAPLLADLAAAVPDRRLTPPPLPVEAVARSTPPPPPVPAPPPPPPRKKALVYVRPPRRRRTRAAAPEGQDTSADAQRPRRRTMPLPGMPPRRVEK
jgi:flagellar biosynthesis protein FlhG